MSDFFERLRQRIAEPLVLVDVGGHGGALESWRKFGDKAKIYCFEARPDDAAGLIESNSDASVEYIGVGLSDRKETIDINVAASVGCSSAFPPIEQLYNRYTGCADIRPVATVTCPTITLDDFVEERGLGRVDGLKIDVQGFELKILRGAEKSLKTCQFVLIEAEFNPMYEGQPLFGDVDRFLREQGFVLWRLGNLVHYATEEVEGPRHQMLIASDPGLQQMVDVSSGQLFWADAFYVRKEATAANDITMSREAAIVGAALASQYHFYDLSLEMIRKSGDEDLLQQLRKDTGASFVETAPSYISAEELRSEFLKKTDRGFEIDFSVTDVCLFFGPYVRLPYGDFVATFHVEADIVGEIDTTAHLKFDVAAHRHTVNSVNIAGSDGIELIKSGRIRVPFHNRQPHADHEFRLYGYGRLFDGRLICSGVTLDRM